jgi:hypothetical protein
MAVAAIIVIVLIAVIVLFGIFFKHKLIINKFIVILLIVSVGYLVISSNLNKNKTETPIVAIPEYQKTAPGISITPQVVQTLSRIYYVSSMTDDGVNLTLYNYYTYDKKWNHYDKPLVLSRNIYGTIKIYQR